jgi:hypothetical protein
MCNDAVAMKNLNKKALKKLTTMDNSANNSLLHAPISQNWMYLFANNSMNIIHNNVSVVATALPAVTKKLIKKPSYKK